ncbi:DUF2934 domain-containing protein [Chelativorans sp. AA-79]|uniref:DUF2934 domain-containing protein n=1 Tax=Chelativorans sp. AA-79 TaxID=3028735 RepID=UPI0023F91630|nr:DUF2934 domain-containing protein [Chelativorans sp. AA-79]WEX10435.1 DUF2934 domain-containing protein [Chelativorans sp. AA-79]
MTTEREDRIRRRAYELWEQEGRPEGREWDHWVQAAREVEAEEGGHAGPGGAEIPPMPEDFPQAEETSAKRTRRSSGGTKSRAKPAAGESTKATPKRRAASTAGRTKKPG